MTDLPLPPKRNWRAWFPLSLVRAAARRVRITMNIPHGDRIKTPGQPFSCTVVVNDPEAVHGPSRAPTGDAPL